MIKLNTLTLLCLLSLMSSIAFAQETKKVSRKLRIGTRDIKESFQVLASDTSVKQGSYTQSFSSYSEKGQYDQGKKTGVWECYGRAGLEHTYDFSTGLFSQEKPSRYILKITQLDDQGQPLKELSPRSIYLGGDAKMIGVLIQTVRYPAEALPTRTQGKVHITAILSKEGKISEAQTTSSIGKGLEEEALRVFRLFPDDWVPVIENGKPVPVKVELQISFSLS